MNRKLFLSVTLLAALLAIVVVILGAYTRLTDAGLGCPDWPGCYAHLTVPKTAMQLAQVAQQFPGQQVEPAKAWAEMIHRYFAGTLGLLVFVIGIWSIARRRVLNLPTFLPWLLMGMIIFQAALGMWTVTLKLMPLVVMGHLLGGFTLLSLLWLTVFRASKWCQQTTTALTVQFRPWVLVGLLILIIQIALGGWTSANYAALVCPGLPMCHGSIMPAWNFAQAFQLWTPFENLDYPAKMTIQMIHRIGAVITFGYLYSLAITILLKLPQRALKNLAIAILLLGALQVTLGILNVVLLLPLGIAVAHNAIAALLLLTLVALLSSLYPCKH
jgi:cytochrome c oxidase assembly protein subunit 15